MKREFAYVVDRMALSLALGNTNQIGRDSWNTFFGIVNTSVTEFVNRINDEFLTGIYNSLLIPIIYTNINFHLL